MRETKILLLLRAGSCGFLSLTCILGSIHARILPRSGHFPQWHAPSCDCSRRCDIEEERQRKREGKGKGCSRARASRTFAFKHMLLNAECTLSCLNNNARAHTHMRRHGLSGAHTLACARTHMHILTSAHKHAHAVFSHPHFAAHVLLLLLSPPSVHRPASLARTPTHSSGEIGGSSRRRQLSRRGSGSWLCGSRS